MDTKTIIKWTIRIVAVLAMSLLMNTLSDKYGRDFVMFSALLIAGLFFCVGKALMGKSGKSQS